MKRYVKVKRSATGVTVATVSLVDGELSASFSSKTYLDQTGAAVIAAEKLARRALANMRQALDEAELAAAEE